jgi:uncharacterized protein YjiS (DUF1127 family)
MDTNERAQSPGGATTPASWKGRALEPLSIATCTTVEARHGRVPPSRQSIQIGAGARIVRLWAERSRARRELAQMTDRDLQDIGMTGCDRWWLIRKPFWQEWFLRMPL